MGGYVSSDGHQVSLAGGGYVQTEGEYVQGSGGMFMVDGLSGGDMSRVESELCPGVGGYTMGPEINPPVLTPSGGHQNTYGWQADGTHPTGMFSCVN